MNCNVSMTILFWILLKSNASHNVQVDDNPAFNSSVSVPFPFPKNLTFGSAVFSTGY